MTTQETINKDLVESMKSRDSVKVSVLRGIKSNFKNKEIELGHSLSTEESLSVLLTLMKQRRDSIEHFHRGDRKDLVLQEEAELEILKNYVPKPVKPQEIEDVVSKVINDLRTNNLKDFGKIMKAVMLEFSGRNIDGKIVSLTVKKRLTDLTI